MSATLFDLETVGRPARTRALVPVDPDACPSCAGQVTTVVVSEPTLFRHGGHGATRRTTTRLCVAALARAGSCRWGLTVDVTEVNPRTADR